MSDLETPYESDARSARHTRRRAAIRVALGSSLAAMALAAFPALSSAFMAAPIVEANPAVQVVGGFNLKGTIYPYELDTKYHFEYGTTTSYGISTPEGDAGSTNGPVQVSQMVTGLTANTTYHFRLVAGNSDGASPPSNDESFTTPADPNAPPPITEPAPAPTEKGSGNSGSGKKVKVKERKISGRTILTTSSGQTLYSLSAEKNGKFICTKSSGCLALWHPLKIASGAKPTGPVKLGTIKRPEGGMQVTYLGRPLYSFAPDAKPGQVKGEGIKDVGTWHAAAVAKH